MNMKAFILFLILSAAVADLRAQQDSLKLPQEKQLYFVNEVQESGYQFAKRSPLLLFNLMPTNINSISLGHEFEKGKFVQAQGSTMNNRLFLKSEGITQLAGIRLYGSLAYDKIVEDSTRFAHQTRSNPSTPYYFGSPAANHYERSIYNFKVLAAKNILTERITIGVELNYHIADHFSNNDPRGSIKEYQLISKLAIGYRLREGLQLGLGYLVGYGQEKFNIGYKNTTYYESLVYPRYVNYIINGYGEPQPRVNRRNYNNFINQKGPKISLNYKNSRLGSFQIIASRTQEDQVYDYRTGQEITELANYHLQKSQLAALWTKKMHLNQYMNIQLDYENLEGEDFNFAFRAKNYVFTGQKLTLGGNYSLQKALTIYNFGMSATSFGEDRIDGITGNRVSFDNVNLTASFGFNKQIKNKRSLGAGLALSTQFNADSQLLVSPANESYFTREVIFHDYLYQTARNHTISMHANFAFPFFKTMQSAISWSINYQINNGSPMLERTVTSAPGRDRLASHFSFNLYF